MTYSFEKKLIKILKNISILLEIKSENPFKSKAYLNAATILKEQKIDIAEAIKNNTLKNIKGIGDALQKKITEYYETGKIQYYENLIKEIPETLAELTNVYNIGIKTAKKLWVEYNITDMNSLEEALLSGKLDKLKGFTLKNKEIMINSIQHKKASKGRFLQEEATEESKSFLSRLINIPEIKFAELSGKQRRFSEVTDELIFIIACDDNNLNLFNNFENLKNPDSETYTSLTQSGIPIIIKICPTKSFYWKLHKTTGSEEYITHFLEFVKEMGYNYDDLGIYKDNLPVVIKSENDIYKILDLQFIPPEIREYPLALQRARKNRIPKLIERSDLKGMIHVHTNWSDGRNSIREMALKAKELGFEYIVICDHSQSASYANGLTIEKINLQHREIDRLNDEDLGIKIIKGIESDIMRDGSLDYPDEILEKFEIVIASVHSHFNISKSEMTRRIIYALMSPYTTMLGHPTGRLLLARPAYQVDTKELIDAAKDYNKIIEINCNPYRLDLSWEDAFYAKSKGLKLSINPDSHEQNTLTDVEYGIKTARKAWLEKSDVINCLEFNEFINQFSKK